MSFYGSDDTSPAGPAIGPAPIEPVGVHGPASTQPTVFGDPYSGPADPALLSQIDNVKRDPMASGKVEELGLIRNVIAQEVGGPSKLTAEEAAAHVDPSLRAIAYAMAGDQMEADGRDRNQTPAQRDQEVAKENAQTQQALGGLLGLGALAGGAAGAGALLGGGAALGGTKAAIDPLTGQPVDPSQAAALQAQQDQALALQQEASLFITKEGRPENRMIAREDHAIERDLGFGPPPRGLAANDNHKATSIGDELITQEKVKDYRDFGPGTQNMAAALEEGGRQYVVAAMGKERGLAQSRDSMSLA